MRDVVSSIQSCLPFAITVFTEDEWFKPGRIDGDQYIIVSLFSSLFVLVILVFVLIPYRL